MTPTVSITQSVLSSMNDSVNIFFTSEIFSDSVPTMNLTQVRWTGGAGSLLLAENIVQKSQLLP